MKRIAVLGTGNIAQTVAVDLKSNARLPDFQNPKNRRHTRN